MPADRFPRRTAPTLVRDRARVVGWPSRISRSHGQPGLEGTPLKPDARDEQCSYEKCVVGRARSSPSTKMSTFSL